MSGMCRHAQLLLIEMQSLNFLPGLASNKTQNAWCSVWPGPRWTHCVVVGLCVSLSAWSLPLLMKPPGT
jgi:hypothetical protein